MPAVLAPPPPIASSVNASACEAVTARPVVPFDSMLAFAPMLASTFVVRVRIEEEAPTPAVEPKARPPA